MPEPVSELHKYLKKLNNPPLKSKQTNKQAHPKTLMNICASDCLELSAS